MIGADTTFLVHLEIAEMPEHRRAHELLRREILDGGEELAIVPQILAEFLHIVTDPRRFQRPLTMEQAVAKAHFWWSAKEVRHVYPSSEATALFLDWIAKHSLGRKRILDTQLAATLWAAGVRRIVTSNVRDYTIYGGFDILTP